MSDVYTPDILRLGTQMPHVGAPEHWRYQATAVSRICGSRLKIWADVDADGVIISFGQDVRACALGQAAASLTGQLAKGMCLSDMAHLGVAVGQMLKTGVADLPSFGEPLAILAPAHPHKGRHGSIMLPFDALREIADQWQSDT